MFIATGVYSTSQQGFPKFSVKDIPWCLRGAYIKCKFLDATPRESEEGQGVWIVVKSPGNSDTNGPQALHRQNLPQRPGSSFPLRDKVLLKFWVISSVTKPCKPWLVEKITKDKKATQILSPPGHCGCPYVQACLLCFVQNFFWNAGSYSLVEREWQGFQDPHRHQAPLTCHQGHTFPFGSTFNYLHWD